MIILVVGVIDGMEMGILVVGWFDGRSYETAKRMGGWVGAATKMFMAWINSLAPSDAMWRQRSESTLSRTTLKRKCRHFDEILITGCTGSCHFDNFQCSQWWKFHQNEDISVSVNGLLPYAPYLNQRWLIINDILWYSFKWNIYLNVQDINPQVVFEIFIFKNQSRVSQGPMS